MQAIFFATTKVHALHRNKGVLNVQKYIAFWVLLKLIKDIQSYLYFHAVIRFATENKKLSKSIKILKYWHIVIVKVPNSIRQNTCIFNKGFS